MDIFLDQHAVGAMIFSLLLLLVVGWVAWKRAFFKLPSFVSQNPVSFRQTLGGFLLYFVFALVLLPLVQIFFIFILGGELREKYQFSQSFVSWLQFSALGILFLLFVGYCFLIGVTTRRFIFWGRKKRSFTRFLKSVGMGFVAWVVSYPFVLVTGLIAHLISVWIWGEVHVEQSAVTQLKLTQSNPVLFSCMLLAVIILVPFMEELLFRGLLQNVLKKYTGRAWGLVLTAGIFALFHFAVNQGVGNFQLILSLFSLSLFLGFIYEREESLWAPIALHVTFNGFSALLIIRQLLV